MAQNFADGGGQVLRRLDPDALDPHCARHRGEIRVFQIHAEIEEAEAFISNSTKPNVPLLSTTIFTGSPVWISVTISPIIIVNPPSPESEMTCRPGKAACAPMACSIAFAIEPWLNDPTSAGAHSSSSSGRPTRRASRHRR